jgi:WD40 repeat protein
MVYSVAVSPDGGKIVSGSDDKTVKVWDLGTGACMRTLTGHTAEVHSVAASPDGDHPVSASADKTIMVWKLMPGV